MHDTDSPMEAAVLRGGLHRANHAAANYAKTDRILHRLSAV